MNPFRRSREFALYRQLVFGARADVPERNAADFPRRDPGEPHSTQSHGENGSDQTPGDAGTETA
jgi:hypothetical protein